MKALDPRCIPQNPRCLPSPQHHRQKYPLIKIPQSKITDHISSCRFTAFLQSAWIGVSSPTRISSATEFRSVWETPPGPVITSTPLRPSRCCNLSSSFLTELLAVTAASGILAFELMMLTIVTCLFARLCPRIAKIPVVAFTITIIQTALVFAVLIITAGVIVDVLPWRPSAPPVLGLHEMMLALQASCFFVIDNHKKWIRYWRDGLEGGRICRLWGTVSRCWGARGISSMVVIPAEKETGSVVRISRPGVAISHLRPAYILHCQSSSSDHQNRWNILREPAP
jgi:hypothetical protein